MVRIFTVLLLIAVAMPLYAADIEAGKCYDFAHTWRNTVVEVPCDGPVDSDGDGVPDDQDACPNEPGDGPDGCPLPPPDRDGDGVPDDIDQCPDEPGLPGNGGCPVVEPIDTDGDGITDDLDQCPLEPGPASNNGCPVVEPIDSDGDGINDDQDSCPFEPGPASNSGCPVIEPPPAGEYPVDWESEFTWPQMVDGWASFNMQSVAYVANDCDGGEVYSSVGDPLNPGDVNEYCSISAAESSGADWVLVKRGDNFGGQTLGVRSGRNYAAYGDVSLPRPIVGGLASVQSLQGLNISGFDFRCSVWSINSNSGAVRDVYIEDSIFNGCEIQAQSRQRANAITDFIMHRSVIVDKSAAQGRPQGFYGYDVSVNLSEMVLDNNGKLAGGPQRNNLYNHNFYVSGLKGSIIQHNISSRAASIGFKNTSNGGESSTVRRVLYFNNLLADNEIGIELNGNLQGTPNRFNDVHVVDNVFTNAGESHPTARELGWGLLATDWTDGVIQNNVLTAPDSTVTNTQAISRGSRPGTNRNVQVRDNIVCGPWRTGISLDATVNESGTQDLGSCARDLEGYDASLGNVGSVESFVMRARENRKGNWNDAYTAKAANAWIRAGY